MEVRPGYKQTEVGVIPAEWSVAALSDVSDKIMVGIASAATHAYRRHGVPLLRNQNIKAGYLDDADVLFVDEVYEQTYRNKRLRAGDLLTARTGYPGMTCVVPKRYTSAQSFTTLITRPKAEVADSGFLSVFINSSQGQRFFDQSQIGGAQKNVNAGALRKMPVPVPALPEQRAIAAALSDVDALLGGLDQLIAKKRDIKQAAMQQLLTGETRLPGFSGEWEVRRIAELTNCVAGGTPSTFVSSYWGGSIKWMNSGELHLRRVEDVAARITEDGLRNSAATILPTRCVLVGLAGQGKTRGTVALNMVELCTNQSIAAVLPSHAFVAEYLYYNLDRRYDELRDLSSGGGGRGGLNLELIGSLPIPLPSIAEQTAIAVVLSDMDAELAELVARRDKTRDLKQAMMQELLTGKTRLVKPEAAHA
ncbi:MAG: restriction endonuclease subunit S [Desulfarculus sp.]|nr:restriction endonuclease subunit S [Desulfarculus sp.]